MESSNVDWIVAKWKPETIFQALAFAKHTQCEDWPSCLNAFQAAMNTIAGLDLKKNKSIKNCIMWARKNQRNAQKVGLFHCFFITVFRKALITFPLAVRHYIG